MRAQQKPLHIGTVVRNAVAFDPKNWREGTAMKADDLPQAVARLLEVLREREIDYLLVGGIALLSYVEGRNTEDLDLILDNAALEQLPGFEIETREANFARGTFSGLQIDVLLASNPLFATVRQDYATTRSFAEQRIRCATVEGLLLLKLYALPSLYRQGDLTRVALYEGDITQLLHAYQPDLDLLFEELRPHLSTTDLNEVRTIVSEIQVRLQRFNDH